MQGYRLIVVFLMVMTCSVAGGGLFDNQAGDGDWCVALNWDPDGVPAATTSVQIEGTTADVVIGGGCAAEAAAVDVGVAAPGVNHLRLDGGDLTLDPAGAGLRLGGAAAEGACTLSGGVLNTPALAVGQAGTGVLQLISGAVQGLTGIAFVGYSGGSGTLTIQDGMFTAADLRTQGGTGLIDIQGGVLNIDDAYLGFIGGDCTVTMSGGAVSTNNTMIGVYEQTGGTTTGSLHMTGGTWTAGNVFHVGRDAGAGHVQLDGGVIEAVHFRLGTTAWTALPGVGTMDLAGGTLVLSGDQVSRIDDYVAAGVLTAFGGAGVVRREYGSIEPGRTVVWGVAPPPVGGPYYVDPVLGDDSYPGALQAPFATLPRAQQAVRQAVAAGLTADLYVYLRAGVHQLADPWFMDAADSAPSGRKVIYAAYAGESPIISGGRPLTGWQAAGADRWTLTVDRVATGDWWFRQLWRNDQRCQRARWPNPGGLLDITAVSPDLYTITVDQAIPGADLPGHATEFVMYHFWASARAKVATVAGSAVTTQTICGTVGATYSEPDIRKPAYLEHHPDYIDQPSEWHLHPTTGMLSYQAAPGEDPTSSDFVAPVLDRLITIAGTGASMARNIQFRGIAFRHAGWNLPATGYSGTQAGYYKTAVGQAGYIVPPAIAIEFAESVRFERCSFGNLGASGVCLGEQCYNNAIIDCEFYDIGGTAIMVGWQGDKNTGQAIGWEWDPPASVPYRNEVRNNYIHAAAAEWFGCVGIFEAFCRESRLIENVVCDLPYTGISTGFRWHGEPYTEQSPLVLRNHIYNVMHTLDDGGGIYCLGNHQGGLMWGNLIHDVIGGWREGYEHQDKGIYFDSGGRGYDVDDNITYNVVGRHMILKDDMGNMLMYYLDGLKDAAGNPLASETEGDTQGLMVWGDTYWDRPPASWGPTEQAIASAAGIQPAPPALTVERNAAGGLVVRGTAAAWATLVDVRLEPCGLDITAQVEVGPAGAVYGELAAVPLGYESVSVSGRVLDPEGDLSAVGTSNALALLAGDYNGDGAVDATDLAVLVGQWLGAGGGLCGPGDIDLDGHVTLTDFAMLARNWLP